MDDEYNLVKLPIITDSEEFINAYKNFISSQVLDLNTDKNSNNSNEISWSQFREFLDFIDWRGVKKSEVQQEINNLYKKTQLLFNQNKKDESFKLLEKAFLLENKAIN